VPLQQKKRQKTLAKIKQLAEQEDSNTEGVQQKGKKSKGGSRKGNQTKGGKGTAPAKKTSGRKNSKQSAAANCNILPYFTVKK